MVISKDHKPSGSINPWTLRLPDAQMHTEFIEYVRTGVRKQSLFVLVIYFIQGLLSLASAQDGNIDSDTYSERIMYGSLMTVPPFLVFSCLLVTNRCCSKKRQGQFTEAICPIFVFSTLVILTAINGGFVV